MKAIAFMALRAALCGGAWAQQGSAYTTPGGTRHYNGPNGYHGSSYTTPGGTTHYSDNRGTSGTSYTTPGGDHPLLRQQGHARHLLHHAGRHHPDGRLEPVVVETTRAGRLTPAQRRAVLAARNAPHGCILICEKDKGIKAFSPQDWPAAEHVRV